jgi:peroxiredoxin
MAPDFTGKTVDGFEFDLSDYKGKVVLLDFYGFW